MLICTGCLKITPTQSNQPVPPPVKLSTILHMDLAHLLLLDLPSGTTYPNICMILNFP